MFSIAGNKKILIGVLHTTREPWLSIANQGQIQHWHLQRKKDFDVAYLFSNTNKLASYVDAKIENLRWRQGRNASYFISYLLMIFLAPFRSYLPTASPVSESESKIPAFALKINIPEMTATMRWKKIAFLEYFLDFTQSDYVIIVNSSSILNFNVIEKMITELDEIDGPVYAGPICQAYDCDFVSGAFTIINRSAVKLLIENLKLMPVHVMDDVAFGTAFKRLKVSITNVKNLNINSLLQLETLSDEEIRKIGHFRCTPSDLTNRNDVAVMHQLIYRLALES